MFALPPAFPLDEYLGYSVQRVVEGSHFVEVHLEMPGAEHAYIQFEGPVKFKSPTGVEDYIVNEQLLPHNSIFQSLMGSAVARVARLSDKSCRFEFSNGCVLDLIGEKVGYESYHLGVAGHVCDV